MREEQNPEVRIQEKAASHFCFSSLLTSDFWILLFMLASGFKYV
jgi:hypothetical protein